MNENTLRPLLGPDGNRMSGRDYIKLYAKKLPWEGQASSIDITSDSTKKVLVSDEEKVSETDEKIDSPETIFLSPEDTKNPSENTISNIDTPVVSMKETNVPMRRSPFPSLEQVATPEQKDPVSPGENSDVVNGKSDGGVIEKNDVPESEKNSNAEGEKNVSLGHIIPTPHTPTSPTNILSDEQPLSKFEEGFAKTLPIEDFPWESRKKTVSDMDVQPEVLPGNQEDETPFSRAIRSDASHTSGAIRKFWSKVNNNLSCLDGALSCVGDVPSDNEWVKERTRALFDNVYNAIELLKQDIFDATEADVKDFIDPENGSASESSETNPEAPTSRGEGLERWARWVGRNEDSILVLKKAPYWSDNNESEVCGTEGIRDSGVDIYLLADVLKESDIGKVRKMVREVSKMKGVDFIFRHPKGMRNATRRLLTSRQEATISGSTIGYVTLEGFFETLAYALAKSKNMNE